MRAFPMFLFFPFTVAAAAEIQPLPEGSSVAASVHDQAVARLRGELGHWQKRISSGPLLLLFAETGEPDRKGPGEIVRVARVGTWPDDTVTSYIIVLDEKHRVRLFQESPVSFSGDWSLNLTYMFDEKGRTVAFQRFSGFFNSGCSEVARERSTEFFGVDGRRIARDYRLEDGNKKPLAPEGCEFPYRHEHRIYSDAKGALETARLADAVRAAGAKLGR